MISPQTLFFALIGGILPALFWLWFWLHEDKKKPEPRGYIIATFFAGMVVVGLALPIQRYIREVFGSQTAVMLLLWAAAEEFLKFGAAWFVSLRKKVMNEPIDGIVYLITAALGFSALENTLFLLDPLSSNIAQGILTGNMRFIGATLLHTLSSGIIGAAIAFSYYRPVIKREIYMLGGLILGTVLHTVFNFFIIQRNTEIFLIFSAVWISVIGLILLFERAKRIHP